MPALELFSLEVWAATLGLVNVVLVVRRSIWNYAFGLAMVALYAVVFARARLYSDALLQGFFFAVQLYGWWNWRRSAAEHGDVVVEALAPATFGAWLLGAAVAAAAWGHAMQRFTDAALPYADAALAAVSIVAQILQSRRAVESWLLWIAVDIGSVALYASKQLWPTCALYGLFLGLAVWGLIDWRARRARPLAA